MVSRKIKESGAGLIGAFPSLLLPEDGKFTKEQVAWIIETLQTISNAINGNLSFGTGASATRGGNFNAQWINQVFPTAGTEVEIPHGLGRVPVDVIPGLPSEAVSFYTKKRKSWNPSTFWMGFVLTSGGVPTSITVPLLVF